MTKSIFPNFKRWTTDEKHLLIVFLLTLIYPVFVTSFYALYIFVLMPVMVSPLLDLKGAHKALWYHFYWLFVSLLWVLLCFLILPFLKKSVQNTLTMSNIESSPLLQPAVKVEMKKEDSQSNLSQKSEYSSDNIMKAVSDSHSEKESLGKSKEILSKSTTSLERKKLTQSGEFLNEFISTIDSEDVKKNETVCEIHAEKSKDADNGNAKKEVKLMDEQDHQPEIDTKNAESHKRKSQTSESSSNDEEEPFIATQKTKPLQTSSPLKINEAVSEQHEDSGESEILEVDNINSDLPNVKRENAIPKIDTSRASGYYECSMPTPLSVESQGSQNNTVFLFINPENETTEDDILVVDGGKVEDSADKKIDP